MHPSKESRLEALVERFWELEAVPELKDSAKYSPEQLACEKSFKDNVRNLSSGRFEVSLPFKIDPKILGSSFETAKRRFLSLERRVSKDLELKEMYVSFMKEYIDLGHMSVIEEGGNEKLLSFNDTDSTKTLGMRWTPSSDTFRYYLDDCFTELSPTKRNILSVAARMFDPLGLLSPISIRAKILLQELWRMQLPWDDTMPMEMHSRWEKFKENLLELHKIAIPSKESRLEALVERFWELEAVPELKDSAKYSPEQLACEKSFKDNVRNLSSGRFEVSLPFKIDPKIWDHPLRQPRDGFSP
ncbi:hypothetical protein ACLKA6_001534 [Drosophila palustris]